jgi:hypothetical protein
LKKSLVSAPYALKAGDAAAARIMIIIRHLT